MRRPDNATLYTQYCHRRARGARSPAPTRCRRCAPASCNARAARMSASWSARSPACNACSRAKAAGPNPIIATVRRVGLDLGITDQTQLTWAVNAPTERVGYGELAGNYGGVGANASVGIGGGGNFLVGGPAKFLRAAADQPAGPDRAERRGRGRLDRAGAGAVRRYRHHSPPAPSSSRLSTALMPTKEARASGPLFFVSFRGDASSNCHSGFDRDRAPRRMTWLE